MRLKQAKEIVQLFSNEWDLGKKGSKEKGNICAWIFFFEMMEESEKIVIEKRNNKVIGICGYSKYTSNKHKLRKLFYRIPKTILIHKNSQVKKSINEYNNNYDYTPKELENYFDGELSILIVDKKYRGHNIGKKMITKIFEYAKKDNIQNLQILTDESCNFTFYEKIGCKKIYEKTIMNKENNRCGPTSSEIGYIYEKKL